jgi:hypothetical protein
MFSFEHKIWINLAQKYIKSKSIDWEKTLRIGFNERSNPDDDELGVQIVKDLHRTGCSATNNNESDRIILKRVLLAYARYNKPVGYCQGFNIIAALLLEVVEKKEEDAFMLMIYLIDHILPQGYYANSLQVLAIDMAVFRELLKQQMPKFSQHLDKLQTKKSTSYEPPLTNVFTMQWFLTIFATCLPKSNVLRIWDCVFLEGFEFLFRTALTIWEVLSVDISKAANADHFYTLMSNLSVSLLNDDLISEKEMICKMYSFKQLEINQLREKYIFNIKPFEASLLKQRTEIFKKVSSSNSIKLKLLNQGF